MTSIEVVKIRERLLTAIRSQYPLKRIEEVLDEYGAAIWANCERADKAAPLQAALQKITEVRFCDYPDDDPSAPYKMIARMQSIAHRAIEG
jgi:hypothetical protein